MNKALNLCYYSMLGNLPLINEEAAIYRGVQAQEIMSAAQGLFHKEKSSTLIIGRGNE